MLKEKELASRILPRSFYLKETEQVAQELLGAFIVRQSYATLRVGRIVETEAYSIDDPACHAFKGKTKANASLFGPVGHAYVYFTYGMHYSFNVVARAEGIDAGGVLIRAVEPLQGIESMRLSRGTLVIQTNQLASGPAKVTQAFALDKSLDGLDLTINSKLFICAGEHTTNPDQIIAKPRIGISRGIDIP